MVKELKNEAENNLNRQEKKGEEGDEFVKETRANQVR